MLHHRPSMPDAQITPVTIGSETASSSTANSPRWTPQADGATPVLLLRGIPSGADQTVLEKWAEEQQYQPRDDSGRATGSTIAAQCVRTLILPNRGIGFVQFVDIWAARAVMRRFVYQGEDSVTLLYQGRRHPITVNYSDRPEIRVRNEAATPPPCPGPAPVVAMISPKSAGPERGQPRLLLCVLKELHGKVGIDELFWLFAQFGRIERISIFTKNAQWQAVVQFAETQPAMVAMGYLNGRELPDHIPGARGGSRVARDGPRALLAIVPSNLTSLTFRNQDPRNRDYVEWNAAVSRGERSGEVMVDFLWGQHVRGEGWLVPPQPPQWRGHIPPPAASTTLGEAWAEGRVGECLHIGGLPDDDSITAEDLWSICGMYGGVRACKLLYHHRGCAVVQMRDAMGCRAAINALHGLRLRGRSWDVRQSTQANAMQWNRASPDLQHRMCSALDPGREQVPVDANQPSAAPSPLLFIWNMPPGVAADPNSDLRRMLRFQSAAAVFEGAAVLQYATTEDATIAAARHNGKCIAMPHHNGRWRVCLRFLSPPPALVEPVAGPPLPSPAASISDGHTTSPPTPPDASRPACEPAIPASVMVNSQDSVALPPPALQLEIMAPPQPPLLCVQPPTPPAPPAIVVPPTTPPPRLHSPTPTVAAMPETTLLKSPQMTPAGSMLSLTPGPWSSMNSSARSPAPVAVTPQSHIHPTASTPSPTAGAVCIDSSEVDCPPQYAQVAERLKSRGDPPKYVTVPVALPPPPQTNAAAITTAERNGKPPQPPQQNAPFDSSIGEAAVINDSVRSRRFPVLTLRPTGVPASSTQSLRSPPPQGPRGTGISMSPRRPSSTPPGGVAAAQRSVSSRRASSRSVSGSGSRNSPAGAAAALSPAPFGLPDCSAFTPLAPTTMFQGDASFEARVPRFRTN